jgi:hypothetical protein
MNPLPITDRQIRRMVLIFVGVIVGFWVLSGATGWPDKQSFGQVVLIALAITLLPIIGPLLAFLRESGAAVGFAGVTVDFSRAPRSMGTEPQRVNLDGAPGTSVNDSTAASIADAAATALDTEIVVVNLGTGRSWYPSRLFALAAAADTLNGAKVIVLLAQRGSIDRHWLGWLRPRDVVRAMIQDEPQYDQALRRAKAMVPHIQLRAEDQNYNPPAPFAFAAQLTFAYRNHGDLAFVPALIHELQEMLVSDPTRPTIHIEEPQAPRWLTREEAERLFDPWLIRDSIREGSSDHEIMTTLARVPYRFIAIVEDGRYVGMVDIDAYVRRLVLQPTQATRVG